MRAVHRDKGYVQNGILEYTVLLNTRPYAVYIDYFKNTLPQKSMWSMFVLNEKKCLMLNKAVFICVKIQ